MKWYSRIFLIEVRIFSDVLHFFNQDEVRGAGTLRTRRKHIIFADPELWSVLTTFMFRAPYSGNGDILPAAEGDLLNSAGFGLRHYKSPSSSSPKFGIAGDRFPQELKGE